MNNIGIDNGYIEFCPDVVGSCVGHTCAAFRRGINFGTKDATMIVSRIGHTLEQPVPLFMLIDVPVCSKYNKLIGEEAAHLYWELLSDIGVATPFDDPNEEEMEEEMEND